jgi:hypothetical protein
MISKLLAEILRQIPFLFYGLSLLAFAGGVLTLFITFFAYDMWSHYFIRGLGRAIVCFVMSIFYLILGFVFGRIQLLSYLWGFVFMRIQSLLRIFTRKK